jgi:actin-related protein
MVQLFSVGVFSSLVIDARESQTDIVPIYDGLLLPAA